MSFVSILREFDGKSVEFLERIDATITRDEESLAGLFAAAKHDHLSIQVGATWLLKRWHEAEAKPEVGRHTTKVVNLLCRAEHWEVQLHLLQILATVRLDRKPWKRLKEQLGNLARSENTFVRAWTHSVFAAIGDGDESFREEALERMNEAEIEDAASVRARIRQIRKRYPWAR